MAAKHGPPSLPCGQRTLRPKEVAKRLRVIAEGLLYSQVSVDLSCQTAARVESITARRLKKGKVRALAHQTVPEKGIELGRKKTLLRQKTARSTSHRFEQNAHPAVGGQSEIYQILGHPAGMSRSPKRNNASFGLPQKFSGLMSL